MNDRASSSSFSPLSVTFTLFTVVLACLTALPTFADVAKYNILDLGTLGGSDNSALGINSSGRVVGFAQVPGGYHPFRTAANSPISPGTDDLGTSGGTESYAYGISDLNQVVGYSSTVGIANSHAFRTASNGKVTASSDLGTLGGPSSIGYAINASGQAVGGSQLTANGNYHAFRTGPNGLITASSDLGSLTGDAYAQGINASGQVVGVASTAQNASSHAFRTTANGIIDATSDLGTLGGLHAIAYGINDSGQAVGSSFLAGNTVQHAFRTTPNGLITPASDLDTPDSVNSRAYGINASGQTVGYKETTSGVMHAFFADVTGPMVDLNDLIPAGSGWTLVEARSINTSGQIVGRGILGGENHPFLLTPVDSVPEPSLVTVVVGCAGWVCLRGRKVRDRRRLLR